MLKFFPLTALLYRCKVCKCVRNDVIVFKILLKIKNDGARLVRLFQILKISCS